MATVTVVRATKLVRVTQGETYHARKQKKGRKLVGKNQLGIKSAMTGKGLGERGRERATEKGARD